jgi:hypothetical protein
MAFKMAQRPGAFDGLKLCAENRLEICRLLTLTLIRTLVSRHFAPPTEQVVIIVCCCPATLPASENCRGAPKFRSGPSDVEDCQM